MTEKNFVAFYEHCGWEGETWRFWLPLEGNGKALEKLDDLIQHHEDLHGSDWYVEIRWEQVLPESSVNILADNSESGYMDYENKVLGVFQVSSLEGLEDEEAFTDTLYKGGVKDLFTDGE